MIRWGHVKAATATERKGDENDVRAGYRVSDVAGSF
jgi:hypothetical protein